MYQAERGLFELKRHRPLLIVSTPGGSNGTSPGAPSREAVTPLGGGGSPNGNGKLTGSLVASVEGLDAWSLQLLGELGGDAPSLIITGHRAEALGLTELAGVPEVAVTLPEDAPLRTITLLAGGVLDRSALPSRLQTRPATPAEAAGLTLARLAHLVPAVLATSVNPSALPRIKRLLESGSLAQVTTEQVTNFSAPPLDLVEVSRAPVPLKNAEHARFILFREPRTFVEHVAIVIGGHGSWPDPVPVRLHSACLTGDIFGSLRCDCGEQLRGSIEHFTESDGGILLYLAQEGRNIGLANKLRAYTIQETGLDTVDADCTLGFGPDERSYEAAVSMLRRLEVGRIQLLTNNPEKMKAMTEAGIQVIERKPLHGTLNRHNLPYVRAKVNRAGHWLEGMLSEPLPDR